MKNIHVLPINTPSRLHFDGKLFLSPNYQDSKTINSIVEGRNIYITNSEEIKDGNYAFDTRNNKVVKQHPNQQNSVEDIQGGQIRYIFKIILTTDQDLIKDGVQAIDDEFLEWFIKNPSCEKVELGLEHYFDKNIDKSPFFPVRYKIIIPKEEPKTNLERLPFPELVEEFAEYYKKVPLIEEPKQETLEEADENNYPEGDVWTIEQALIRRLAFINGAKWQAERMYSEEEVIQIILDLRFKVDLYSTREEIKEWFEQFFKKK